VPYISCEVANFEAHVNKLSTAVIAVIFALFNTAI
jgi:hypothetical protein